MDFAYKAVLQQFEIISNNPFRILGVWTNAKQAEIVRNVNRTKAYLNVGKNVDLPMDMSSFLSAMDRTVDKIQAAQASINLPTDKLRCSLFWFCNASAIDDIGLNNLISGDAEKALSIFSKRDTYSSLVNRAVISLLVGDYSQAVNAYTQLLHDNTFRKKFVVGICGDTFQISEDDMSHLLMDELAKLMGAEKVFDLASNASDKAYVKTKVIEVPIAKINGEISKAKNVSATDAAASLKAGNSLVRNTKSALASLRMIMGSEDMQFQSISDNLAKQILQCGINYFNNTDDEDDVDKALKLQKYALNIAVGKLVKDRCKQNVDILLKKKEQAAYASDLAAIASELKSFRSSLMPSISRVRSLVNNCKPHLDSLKQKTGSSNELYLQTSTVVANNALGMLIEVVNNAQDSSTVEYDVISGKLVNTIDSAIDAMSLIGKLDMTPQERLHFNQNYSTLQNIKSQLTSAIPSHTSNPDIPTQGPSSDKNWGCIIYIIIGVIISIISAVLS